MSRNFGYTIPFESFKSFQVTLGGSQIDGSQNLFQECKAKSLSTLISPPYVQSDRKFSATLAWPVTKLGSVSNERCYQIFLKCRDRQPNIKVAVIFIYSAKWIDLPLSCLNWKLQGQHAILYLKSDHKILDYYHLF